MQGTLKMGPLKEYGLTFIDLDFSSTRRALWIILEKREG